LLWGLSISKGNGAHVTDVPPNNGTPDGTGDVPVGMDRDAGAGPPFHCHRTHRGCPVFEGWEREPRMLGAARSINLISVPAVHLILVRRAKDAIYQSRGEDGPTSADISAPRGRVAFALIQAMVLGSPRDAEPSLSPALSCLYGYDTYITVRTTSLVQNVPRGTLECKRRSWYGLIASYSHSIVPGGFEVTS
jgi:hypothetical protein